MIYVILTVWTLWVFYLACMNLSKARSEGTLSTVAYIVGYPVLIIGLLLDFLVNVVVFTVILFEWPKELTVTRRLKRHIKLGGWRAKVAAWLAKYILDPFDPSGRHI